MIQVYHGTTQEIKLPDAQKGRDNLDFGKAFYVTRLKEQAAHWAQVVWSRYEENTPVINKYTFDLEKVGEEGYKILKFEEYSQEWLEFIVNSRLGKKPWLDYDVIEGGVANDRIIDTIEGYMAGDFSVEVATGRLKYHKPNNQIAILNQEIIDRYLHFVSSEILPAE